MKIALAQISPHLGDLEKNLEIHLRRIEDSRRKKADLVVFPELSLTGYTLMDLVPEVALHPGRHTLFKKFSRESLGIDIVAGFVEEKEPGLFYNSAVYLSGGEIVHLHRKVFLPTFGMFEEAKFFAAGRSFKTFDTRFGRTGLMICRDFLSYGAGYLLLAGGADIIIVVSAAPGRGATSGPSFGTARMWELMGEAMAFFSTALVIYVNRVGYEDGKIFAGGSFVFGPSGKLEAKASNLEEELLIVDLDLEEIKRARKKWTFRRDDRPEIILQNLRRIVERNED